MSLLPRATLHSDSEQLQYIYYDCTTAVLVRVCTVQYSKALPQMPLSVKISGDWSTKFKMLRIYITELQVHTLQYKYVRREVMLLPSFTPHLKSIQFSLRASDTSSYRSLKISQLEILNVMQTSAFQLALYSMCLPKTIKSIHSFTS
jgi:hypothetical protein